MTKPIPSLDTNGLSDFKKALTVGKGSQRIVLVASLRARLFFEWKQFLLVTRRPSVRNHCHKASERVTKGTDQMWDRAPLGSSSRECSLRLTGGLFHPVKKVK